MRLTIPSDESASAFPSGGFEGRDGVEQDAAAGGTKSASTEVTASEEAEIANARGFVEVRRAIEERPQAAARAASEVTPLVGEALLQGGAPAGRPSEEHIGIAFSRQPGEREDAAEVLVAPLPGVGSGDELRAYTRMVQE